MNWIEQINRNLIVEASAGTGKTHNLLQRILRLIAQDSKLRMRQLVAITFTEKAATELRTRLRKELAQKSTKFKERDNPFARALSEFEQAEISTIHSFCARLLRLRPIEAKISPAFEVIEPSVRDLLFEKTWDNWLTQKLDQDKKFFQLLRRSGVGADNLKKLAKELFANRDLLDQAKTEWQNFKNRLSIPEAEKKFYQLYQRTKTEAPKIKVLNRLMDNLKNLIENAGENKDRVLYQFKSDDLERGKIWKSPEATKINVELIEIFDQVRAGVLPEFLEGILEFLEQVQEEKKKQEALDFEDLLFMTRDLLKNHREVRRYFKERFKYILVDEFQDTDPVQVEIAFFLAEELNSHAEDWTKVKLQPGKLFLVGDPKQSLYRFRRADLKIYQMAKELVEKSNSAPQPVLKENYRSHPKILEWVNYTFEAQFNQENQDYGKDFQPQYESLNPSPADWKLDPRLPQPVVILELEGEGEEKYLTEQIREIEANTVADFIQWAISSELKIWDRRTQKMEQVKYRDFVILYPTHDSASFVKEILRNRNLPFQVADSKDFPAREEIAGLLSLLKTLANPLDNVALVSALRSLFFGVSDAELFQFKFSGGTWNWLETSPKKISVPTLACAYQFLQELYAQRDHKSVTWLIEKAIEKSRLRKLQSLNPRFTQALLNLERIKATARHLEQNPNFTLSDFIDWLEMMGGEESTWPELLAEDAEDAITLSTIHKAKGLEFPVVILINLCGELQDRKSLVIKDWKQHQLEICLENYATPRYFAKKEEEKQHKNCELLRQFYVATTRAQNYLVLPDFRALPLDERMKKNTQKQYINFISAGMPLREDKEHPLQKSIFRLKISELKPKPQTQRGDKLKVFLSQKPAETEIEKEKALFAKEHQEKIEQAKVYKEIKLPSKTEEVEIFEPEAGLARRHAMDIGVLIHRVVEIAGKETREEALSLAKRLAKESELDQSWEEIEQLINAFWESDLKKELDTLPAYQEVPFLMEDDGILWRGKIDLILREKPGLKLLDLKTDHLSPDQIADRNHSYQTQMKIYQKALNNLRTEKLLSTEVFYLRLNHRSKI